MKQRREQPSDPIRGIMYAIVPSLVLWGVVAALVAIAVGA